MVCGALAGWAQIVLTSRELVGALLPFVLLLGKVIA